jgi:hypothetical protein
MKEHAMSDTNLHLVFNRPPTGLTNEEFNKWAEFHFDEILAVPGWASARRFRLEPDVQPSPPIPFPYMSLYELEGDPHEAVRQLHKAHYDFPSWFERARGEECFASWNCIAMGGRIDAPRR